MPAYLVEPLEYDITGLDLYEGRIQLVDFGSGEYLANQLRFVSGTDDDACHSILYYESTEDNTHTPLAISSGVSLPAPAYTSG